MNWLIHLKTALVNLRRNKFRTFLTLLGIILGIASIISIYTIGIGFSSVIEKEFESLGTNTLLIFPFKLEIKKGAFRPRSYERLRISDIKAIKNNFKEITLVVPKINDTARVSYKSNFSDNNMLVGTIPEFFLIGSKSLNTGSYFGALDILRDSQVCVLGSELAKKLFEVQNPVGKVILIKKIPFKVIGVLEESLRGLYFGNLNKEVIMPYTALEKRLQGERNPYISEARLAVSSGANISNLKNEVNTFLRKIKKIPPGKEEEFTVTTGEELGEAFKEIISNYILFLSVVAFMSLFIGGIGIMNIMLVTVAERAKEIGIRRAFGAREKDITLQFLVEAVTLCIVGGALGVLLGILGSHFISKGLQYPTKISWEIIFIALFYALIVGIIFGYYPAKRAAILDPIEALRLE